jgi:hypothetical protein
MFTSRGMLAVAVLAALILAPAAALGKVYDFNELALNPTVLDGKPLHVDGVVQSAGTDDEKLQVVGDWSYFYFKLVDPNGTRYVNVSYYTAACGKPISKFDLTPLLVRDGVIHSLKLDGVFHRAQMDEVTDYLGELEVNGDARDKACYPPEQAAP